MAKAIRNPAAMLLVSSGSVTLKNAWMGLQPRSRAASVRDGSIWVSFGMTDRMM